MTLLSQSCYCDGNHDEKPPVTEAHHYESRYSEADKDEDNDHTKVACFHLVREGASRVKME